LGHGPASVPLNAEAPSRVCVPNVAAAVVAALIDSVAAGRARNVNEPDADVGELDASPQAPWLRRGGGGDGPGILRPERAIPRPERAPRDEQSGGSPVNWTCDIALDTRRIRTELEPAEEISRRQALVRPVLWERKA
jgi:hypothetical protein